ncbi:DUF397 domain-containing protein [Kitasatospora sp. NPDC056138]|uniref:DUF397 domain-containing protein n=1 Tax=Kitasatospora sp. NPDC056138 TaxID=3345724 RepID=UPI0035DEF7A5
MSYYSDASATGFPFKRSSYSGGNDNCVECAAGAAGEVAVCDSKDPQGPAHRYPSAAFRRFTAAVGTNTLVPVN